MALLNQAIARVDNLTRVCERAHYTELVNDGGRPWYPIDLLDEVSENPARYREILRYWHPHHQDRFTVFGVQSRKWREFLQFQKDNRGINDNEAEFSAYVESEKRRCERENNPRGVEFYSTRWKLWGEWEYWQILRDIARKANRKEYNDGGFSGYVAAVKDRIVRDGYTRDLQLEKDPARQDTLTTWIEYLSYEIRRDSELAAEANRLRQIADTSWRELERSDLLGPDETQESVLDIANGNRRAAEKDAALEAVQSAKSDVEAVLKTTEGGGNGTETLGLTTDERTRIKEAKSKYEAAEKSYRLLWKRWDQIGNFVRAMDNYRREKEAADRQKMLLSWIREQLTLIEAESKQANKARHGPRNRGSREKRSRYNKASSSIAAHDQQPRRSARLAALRAVGDKGAGTSSNPASTPVTKSRKPRRWSARAPKQPRHHTGGTQPLQR